MTSVIHSFVHVPKSLRNFGPMQNYSTFNFEGTLGMLSNLEDHHDVWSNLLTVFLQDLSFNRSMDQILSFKNYPTI